MRCRVFADSLIPTATMVWFEVFLEQPHVVLPSFELSLLSSTYQLAAVVYGNGSHFVACLSTPLGAWWYYDGQVNGGRPVADSITHNEDLVTCRAGYTMNALIYCTRTTTPATAIAGSDDKRRQVFR